MTEPKWLAFCLPDTGEEFHAAGVGNQSVTPAGRTIQEETFNFDDHRLAKAIATRDRSYKLLLWISDAMSHGQLAPARAANHSGGPDAATKWLRCNYRHLPNCLRPPKRDIDEFAAFFSTYLTSSFDVLEHPGANGGPMVWTGCGCEFCPRIVNAPRLQAKKPFSRDKKRANRLMVESMVALARERGLAIGESLATRIANDEVTRRQAAYLSYGQWLIRRLEGVSDGPAILVLWRLIAWNRRKFTLRVEDFRLAEEQILSLIQIANAE